MMNKRIEKLQQEIDQLNEQLKSEELLQEIWIELGPYTSHLSSELLLKLHNHFDFDDSE